jgi:hypothetical protein
MIQPIIQCLAVYRNKVSRELLEEAMESKYGGIDLSDAQLERVKREVMNEISSAVLIKLLVSNPDEQFNLSDFHQPDSDQAAYEEVYLTEDGRAIIPTRYLEIPKEEVFQVGFYLHYFDPQKPLITSYGVVELPLVEDMPESVQELIPYHPVD